MRDKVLSILKKIINCDDLLIDDDTPFEAEDIDSLVIVEFVMELESEFNVEIDTENMEKLKTIRSTCDVLQSLIKSGGE